ASLRLKEQRAKTASRFAEAERTKSKDRLSLR
ncbi:MAG: hypothetical protein ACI857_001117, partial [Arenicella sp.]